MKRSLLIALSTMVMAAAGASVRLRAQEAVPRVVEISARRFEFTPNQITLKRGERVTLHLTSADRVHGLYQKDLKIALDLDPQRAANFTFVPEKSGRFVAICDHFCGSGHGNMKLAINVEP